MNLSTEGERLLERIRGARAERATLPRDPSSSVGLDEAYRVQAALGGDRRPKGYKLGLLSPAKQAQMGIDSPIYGRVYPQMLHEGAVRLSEFIQPRVEPELAVVLGEDLPSGARPGEAWLSVGGVFLGVDILDSVWEGYRFGAAEVIADNASGGGFLLGQRHLDSPLNGTLRLHLNGELLSEGSVEDLGDPAERLAWLATNVGGLEAGQVVFLGSPAAAVQACLGTLEVRGPDGAVLVARLEE